MNLLFVVPYTPTPIRTRPYNLLLALKARGHRVTLASLWESQAERSALDALAQDGFEVLAAPLTRPRRLANTLQAALSGLPLQGRYCWQPALAAQISARLAEGGAFDAVHVEHLRGAEYARLARAKLLARRSATPVVWDSVDCISLLFEQAARHSRSPFGRWMARLELPRTRRYEGRLVAELGRVLTTSPIDQAALLALSPAHSPAAVRVLPNGVDTDYFSPAAAPAQSEQIVLSGKMSYHANITAALYLVNDIMPMVWRQRPQVQVVLAGSAPTRDVLRLAQQHGPRVVVTGYVPDLRPHFWASAVAVAPTRYGAGIQNKVLEAMACGLPVVASPQASLAIQAAPGQALLVAEQPADFAQAIVQLLDSPALRQAIGAAGRRYVVQEHRWNGMASRLEALYDEFAGASAQSARRGDGRAEA